MIDKIEPTRPIFRQDPLLDEMAMLGVVRTLSEGFDKISLEELMVGYSSMMVLTYSSNVPSIASIAGELVRRAPRRETDIKET